jgi:hypothetical protein
MRRALVLLALAGCGGAQHPKPWNEWATIGINSAAHALEVTDAVLASEYTARSAHVTNLPDLDALDAQFEPAHVGIELARETLITAERAVTAAVTLSDAPAKCEAAAAVQEALNAAEAVAGDLQTLHVAVPAVLTQALPTLRSAAGQLLPACPTDGGVHAG